MSHVSPDSPQQKKISAKTGDQLPISNISNSNSTESYFKLPLEHHSSSKLNTLVSSLNRGQSSQRRWDHGGHSQVDRWTEISSEDSYSSRPPDYFSTEVSDSSDTTMASNMRTELDRSQKPVTFYPSSSAPQLHRASTPSTETATKTIVTKENHSSSSRHSISTLMPAPEHSNSLLIDRTDSISSLHSQSPDLDKLSQSARESAYPSLPNSSESNVSSMGSDTRNEQNQIRASRYTQPQPLPSIPEVRSSPRASPASIVTSESSQSAKREELTDVVKYSRKRTQHEAMVHARNQRIARFRADYTARKGSHRFASSHYSSNRSITVSGSNTSDASDHNNNDNSVYLSNWKLKRIKVGEALAIVLGGIHYILDKPWHSTRIVSRIDERTLVSSSGKIYRLFGEIDIEGMLLNEFPLELCHQFQGGFPPNWGQLILPYILPPSSAEIPSFMQRSRITSFPDAMTSSAPSSATLSTGTDYDYPTEQTATPSKLVNEHASPMSWRNHSSMSSSANSTPMRNLTNEAVRNDACESDSCQGDYSNISDTTYQTDGSKRDSSTSSGVQTVVPPTAKNMDDSGSFSHFSVHHIQANSVNYPHTPWGITYKTLKRRQDESADDVFQLPARKRVLSDDIIGSDTAMNDSASNNERGYHSTLQHSAAASLHEADAKTSHASVGLDKASNTSLRDTMNKEGQNTIADGGTKFGVG